MMLTLQGPFGSTISLDFRARFGEFIELQCFQFVVPPIECRFDRGDEPLQDWQQSNTDIYDLQHGPGVTEWARDGHSFINDIHHRHDVMTCGLLSRDLLMETHGLGVSFLLLVWLRESTRRNP